MDESHEHSRDDNPTTDTGAMDAIVAETAVEDPLPPRTQLVPVVGLGGSAGSLDAMQKFFASVEVPSGYAYVVVVHLSPEHDSALAPILQRSTTMPVEQVNAAVRIQPDHVYVIPPGKHFSMSDGKLHAVDMQRTRGRHVIVDLFFRALAETHGVRAVAIILSGGDGDGANGIKRVKERGGLTISQTPGEAEQDGMPRAAIATGMVDWVLPVAEMAERLRMFRENETKIVLPDLEEREPNPQQPMADPSAEGVLREVLSFLKARTDHDFSYYKRATVLRRIARRMQVNSADTLAGYLAYMRTHPGEAGALLKDLLISVTNFFQDKSAFHALGAILPEMFRGKGPDDQVRVWVPGCATGEEAYSIAILLWEFSQTLTNPPAIQVFATDLDKATIDIAREGRYPLSICADLSDGQLKEFFTKDAGGYPGAPRAAGKRVVRVSRFAQGLAVFPAGSDFLPESPDLLEPQRPGQGVRYLPFRPATHGISVAGVLGIGGRRPQPVPAT